MLAMDMVAGVNSSYDELTLRGGKRDTCYYGRVVDQCGYRQSWYDPRRWAGLECMGGPDCDHESRGYYSFATTDSAWQEDWGTDEEWDEWARAAG